MTQRKRNAYDPQPLAEGLLPESYDWTGEEWKAHFIAAQTAKRWLNAYHYLGGTHAVGSYGVFAPDLIAVVSIGQPANRHGVAGKFALGDWKGNHEITRVGCHPDAPKNTATRAIALACRAHCRPRGLDWLFSYSDTGMGHHGGIYQGLNAVYVGLSPARTAFLLDGEPVHIRTLANRFKCEGPRLTQLLAAEGHVLERIPRGSAAKHTYVLLTGGRRTNRAIRRHLEAYALPYPKRVASGPLALASDVR